MTYTLLKLLHITAVIIFLGNIITGLFWMRIAVKTKDISIISHSIKGIIHSDKLFTIPGVLLIVAGGVLAAIVGHLPILRTGWIFWSLVLFSISGMVFAWKVAPLQRKIHTLTLNQTDFDWRRFETFYNQWEIWGLIALLTPLTALVLMTLKIPR